MAGAAMIQLLFGLDETTGERDPIAALVPMAELPDAALCAVHKRARQTGHPRLGEVEHEIRRRGAPARPGRLGALSPADAAREAAEFKIAEADYNRQQAGWSDPALTPLTANKGSFPVVPVAVGAGLLLWLALA